MTIEKNTIIRISLTPAEVKSVKTLLEAHNLTKPHDLFRHLLTIAYKQEVDNRMRYQKSDGAPKVTKADREVEAIATMEAMSDEELTKHLGEIGFKDFNVVPFTDPSNDNNLIRDYIGPVSAGGRGWIQETINLLAREGTAPYLREVYSWSEIVNQLKKQRIIK